MEYTENDRLMMKVQICNHHHFWKNKKVEEYKKLDSLDDFSLNLLFKDSLVKK